MKRIIAAAMLLALTASASDETRWLKTSSDATGRVLLTDKRAGVDWPLDGAADAKITNDGQSVIISATPSGDESFTLLKSALQIAPGDNGYVLVPCREGLLIPSDGPVEFSRRFATCGYEGCHMNMMGFIKHGAALLMTWDDVYIAPELVKKKDGLSCSVHARRPPHTQQAAATSITLTPLGRGDLNTVATAYREIAERKGFAVTLRSKVKRNPEAAKLLGASNVKLWTCLARRRNEESTKDESVVVNWTFDEAAKVAEHLRRDLGIERCLFTLGGWTEGGYDCRHPDALPANAECGGNEALADAVRRIKALGYVACFHDNYQDMYRDAKSWNEDFIQKKPDGSLMRGGRWLGGRAYLVCAPKTVELAQRPQNLPSVKKLFAPQAYFIDTTYAVDPQECFDPKHPLTRADDIRWKQKLSDYSRGVFGLFGSECGREWAIGHSDFFEGLSGVSGKYFHNLDPSTLGATVVPLFEMVYHDCENVYGKYGYKPGGAAEYVAHHVLCGRTLNYHSMPNHLYWNDPAAPDDDGGFARADHGWAAGMCLTDRFLKNTHEILGPLNEITAHARLAKLEFLTPDRAVRRATYEERGRVVATVTVNFGAADFVATSKDGGNVTLPADGFLIESPKFVAFHAASWAGRRYERPVLFTLRIDGRRTRVFHGFGDSRFTWRGREIDVVRETDLSR